MIDTYDVTVKKAGSDMTLYDVDGETAEFWRVQYELQGYTVTVQRNVWGTDPVEEYWSNVEA